MKKENLNEPVTKEYLGEFTQDVIFPRIEELANKITNLQSGMGELQGQIFKLEKRMDGLENNIIDFKDEILTSNDKLAQKLDIIIAEQAAHSLARKRQNDRIDDHDKRIKRVEGKLKINSFLKKPRVSMG